MAVPVPMSKRWLAELLGTMWLVFGGCGAAVLAGTHIGFTGVAFAFGLTVLTMAYAIGHLSGCHLNPAVSLGLVIAGRFPARELLAYVSAQVAGAILGALLVLLVASGRAGFDLSASGLAANGVAEHSPGGYSLVAGLVVETVLTFGFVLIILGATDRRAPTGFAPIAIGLGLTLIHLIGIRKATATATRRCRTSLPEPAGTRELLRAARTISCRSASTTSGDAGVVGLYIRASLARCGESRSPNSRTSSAGIFVW